MDELANFEGGVVHIGDRVPMVADSSFQAQPTAAGLVDGTPDPKDSELRVRFIGQRDEPYTLAEADTIAGKLASYLHRLHHGS